MSKEALARAANSDNLEMEPGVVHDVDRLTAAATGNVLGGLLLRLRESGQPQWARRVVLHLVHRIANRFGLMRTIATRTAVCALHEFMHPHCQACNGARELVTDQVRLTCPDCGGSGQQRFDNASRRRAIGSYGRRIDGAMADCHRHMADAMGAYLGHAAARLGSN